MAVGDPGAALSDRSRRRRGVDRRRAARRVRGHAMTRATSAPPSRRATTCSAWPSRRRADCAGPTGRIRADAARRRTSRASTTAPPGSATTSGGCSRSRAQQRFRDRRARRHALGDRAGRGPACPQTACSWRWTDDPSWRVAYNGVGMGQAGIVLTLDAFADRTGDPTFRAYARAGAARLRELTADGARPLPRGSEDDDRRDRVPLRLGRSGLHVPRALPARPRSRRPRTARRLLDWVNEQAVAAPLGRAALADRDR